MELVGNTDALSLLRELDDRQDRILLELDELCNRVERVLESYLESRKPKSDSDNSSTFNLLAESS
jgi:hypothetical protein